MNEDTVITPPVDPGWSRETLTVWRRAKHQCEYCGADLLACDDDYCYGAHVDHIVPGANNHPDNIALACKTCNFIKSDRTFADANRVQSRAEIITKVKEFIREERGETEPTSDFSEYASCWLC